MDRVIQKDKIGCGIACVAMLATVSYDQARRTIFGESKVETTDSTQLKNALTSLGK